MARHLGQKVGPIYQSPSKKFNSRAVAPTYFARKPPTEAWRLSVFLAMRYDARDGSKELGEMPNFGWDGDRI
jgi:hypothetical protein